MSTQTTDGQATSRAARRASGSGGFGPGGDRLPVPTRQRRPMLAVLAVVLILGGAAIAATLVLTSGQKQQYLLLSKNVAVGQTLTRDDFFQQPLAATNSAVFAPVPVEEFASRVNGKKARVPLTKGSLLTEGTFGDEVSPPVGLTDVSLVVPAGAAPTDLAAGDVVKILYTPRTSQGSGGDSGSGSGVTTNVKPQAGKPLPRGLTLVTAARVASVDRGNDGDSLVVGVQVPNDDLTASPNSGLPVIAAASAGNALSLIRLDPTTTYPTGTPG